jgi:hypothetical protein
LERLAKDKRSSFAQKFRKLRTKTFYDIGRKPQIFVAKGDNEDISVALIYLASVKNRIKLI